VDNLLIPPKTHSDSLKQTSVFSLIIPTSKHLSYISARTPLTLQ